MKFFGARTLVRDIRSLPWRAMALFVLLWLACAIPGVYLVAFLHEVGHILGGIATGGEPYAVVLGVPVPEAYAIVGTPGSSTFKEVVRSLDGMALAAAAGIALFFWARRIRSRSSSRILFLIVVGLSTLASLWYLIYGYFGSIGDLWGWREELPGWTRALWGFFMLLCIPVGYWLGRYYAVAQEDWISSRTPTERVLIALGTMGFLYGLTATVFLCLRPTIWIALPHLAQTKEAGSRCPCGPVP